MHDHLRWWSPRMDAASDGLAVIVKLEAHRASQVVGYGYRPAELAPNTYDEAVAEAKAAQYTGLAYRVSTLHSEATIFRSPATNYALRFWHDMVHVIHGTDFSPAGERRAGEIHLRVLREDYGVSTGSLVGRLMWLDSIGQYACHDTVGVFPEDQRRFATIALRSGLKAAIRVERVALAMRGEVS